jgi:antitoxin (DNA-binding transcriptional repressor) of toxin-antitoxin stability system
MKHVINIYEARRHLSRRVDEADEGADLVIAVPESRLRVCAASSPRRENASSAYSMANSRFRMVSIHPWCC